MLSYHGYGKEILYYSNLIGLKATDIFDNLIENPDKYPISNKIFNSYVNIYTKYMFDAEKDLENFIKTNIKNMVSNTEKLTKITKSRSLYDFIVEYMFKDPNKLYLKEVCNSILDLKFSNKNKKELDIIFNLAVELMIDPYDRKILLYL